MPVSLTFPGAGQRIANMRIRTVSLGPALMVWGCMAVVSGVETPEPAHAAPPLEYCGHQAPDKQWRAAPGGSSTSRNGCTSLIEKKDSGQGEPRAPRDGARQMKIDNLQAEVVNFLQQYHRFLDCCRTDLGAFEQIKSLSDDVNDLLTLAQSGLFSEHMKLRGWTLSELLTPVAKARRELAQLRTRLDAIAESRGKLGGLDYEAAGSEMRAIHDAEEAIHRDFQARPLPSGPKTGTSIGATSTAGPSIGKAPKTAADIGGGGIIGGDIGTTHRAGADIGAGAPTGFEIGTTGRAGSSIGDSTLNHEQSSIGSSLQPSTVGSSLGDSTITSTFGGSTTPPGE